MKTKDKNFWYKWVLRVIVGLSISFLAACAPVPGAILESTLASTNLAETQTMEPLDLFERYTVVGISSNSTLSIHQRPSLDSPILGRIPPNGTDILPNGESHHDEDRIWISIVYGGLTGWVDLDFLAEQQGILPEELITLGQQVLELLRTSDYTTLAALIPPESCLRFSPYSYLNPDNQLLCPTELDDLIISGESVTWGHYDGTGLPINLNFSEYHQKFVYDQDYRKSAIVGFDTAVSSGNAINNISEIYPDGVMIEYYFPGFDPQYGGLDWRSLRLVFIPNNGHWYLAAIIHNEWTI